MQQTNRDLSSFRLFSPSEVEEAYGPRLSELTLQSLRSSQKGPRYRRIGRAVVYRAADIEAWLDDGLVDPTGVVPTKLSEGFPHPICLSRVLGRLRQTYGTGRHTGLVDIGPTLDALNRLLLPQIYQVIDAVADPVTQPRGQVTVRGDGIVSFYVSHHVDRGQPDRSEVLFDPETGLWRSNDSAGWDPTCVGMLAFVFSLRQPKPCGSLEAAARVLTLFGQEGLLSTFSWGGPA